MTSYLDFEKPIAALESRILELRDTADEGSLDIQTEIDKLQAKSAKMLSDTYAKLTPWQKTQVAKKSWGTISIVFLPTLSRVQNIILGQ